MSALTPEVLSDLRKKAEQAGAHEWSLEKDEIDGCGAPRYVMHGVIPVANVYSTSIEDAEHIAAANPAVILALLDRIEALEGTVRAFMEDPYAYTPRAVEAARELGLGGNR